jgi:hypothetical protein
MNTKCHELERAEEAGDAEAMQADRDRAGGDRAEWGRCGAVSAGGERGAGSDARGAVAGPAARSVGDDAGEGGDRGAAGEVGGRHEHVGADLWDAAEPIEPLDEFIVRMQAEGRLIKSRPFNPVLSCEAWEGLRWVTRAESWSAKVLGEIGSRSPKMAARMLTGEAKASVNCLWIRWALKRLERKLFTGCER